MKDNFQSFNLLMPAHDIDEILLRLMLNTNQSIKQSIQFIDMRPSVYKKLFIKICSMVPVT
jgi:hypothetical protein